MAGKTIHAAGGIVVRNGARPLIAVVQRSKDELWVLPRGKLKRKESPLAGAHREVVEETGHNVRVREFLGVLTYRARGRPKLVQFWRMQAAADPSRDLMKDIMAVEWLPLVGGGAAAELPAGKTVPAQRWADGVASAQASSSQDTPRDQNEGAPARGQNERQQIEIASHHGIARPRGKGRGTFRGARPPGEYLAAGARAPGALDLYCLQAQRRGRAGHCIHFLTISRSLEMVL